MNERKGTLIDLLYISYTYVCYLIKKKEKQRIIEKQTMKQNCLRCGLRGLLFL